MKVRNLPTLPREKVREEAEEMPKRHPESAANEVPVDKMVGIGQACCRSVGGGACLGLAEICASASVVDDQE